MISKPSGPDARRTLDVDGRAFDYYSLSAALQDGGLGDPARFPVSICILLENLLRSGDGRFDPPAISALTIWRNEGRTKLTIPFRPARVLLQDYTGIPVLVDLAALRDAAIEKGLATDTFDCKVRTDLIIDHSISVDISGVGDAAARNTAIEIERNRERFAFLQWAEKTFKGLTLFPPGSGICHQINLEHLADVVCIYNAQSHQRALIYPDTVLGADSHTTMINALGVLGWGVGGIEALSAILGNPIAMQLPDVVGVQLTGRLSSRATATDLVLTLTERLRQKNVVGRFVEFFGPGLATLSVADRATVANMAPEAGATCAFFPIDSETLKYLRLTGRKPSHVQLIEAYAKAQGLWRDSDSPVPNFTDSIDLSLDDVEPCVAGPSRPEERIPLSQVAEVSRRSTASTKKPRAIGSSSAPDLHAGDVVLAAITSCTNTANPHSVITAGLLARNAVRKGLSSRPWVKTSFAPGSRVTHDYLVRSSLQSDLDALGFQVVGYGCTTCIGNAGPLLPSVMAALQRSGVTVSAVLSGNRNFANRVHPLVAANFLASPALVVAYAIAGSTNLDLTLDPLGLSDAGKPVYLHELWPSRDEVDHEIETCLGPTLFSRRYENIQGAEAWSQIEPPAALSPWEIAPTYVARPPFVVDDGVDGVASIVGARILALYGDGITTDHISPASPIRPDSLAGGYLMERGVAKNQLHTFGARRGHWEVMLQGAFSNPNLRNEMVPAASAGMTRHAPTGALMLVQEAAALYRREGAPLVLIAGRNYGAGSSRDDAAKSTRALGIRAVIAESFERIHRSNLLAMGVLPLAFPSGMNRRSLALTGDERLDIDLGKLSCPGAAAPCQIWRMNSRADRIDLTCCIETDDELEYLRCGGILPSLLRHAVQSAQPRGSCY